MASGLDDEDVLAADVLHDLHHDLTVAEAAQNGLTQRDVQIVNDILSQLPIRVTGKH
jgi:hypothetical protein